MNYITITASKRTGDAFEDYDQTERVKKIADQLREKHDAEVVIYFTSEDDVLDIKVNGVETNHFPVSETKNEHSILRDAYSIAELTV